MQLYTTDYAILSVSVVAGVIGLFLGFSGAMSFLAASVISAFSSKLVWTISASYLTTAWTRGLVTVIATLLVFGFLIAAFTGILLSSIAVYLINFFQLVEIRSVFVSEVMSLC